MQFELGKQGTWTSAKLQGGEDGQSLILEEVNNPVSHEGTCKYTGILE